MHPVQVYENVLFKNLSHITSIELCIRILYYTLPGRFQDSKFVSQTLYSGLNLIRLYHNSILRSAAVQVKQQYPNSITIEETQFNKYKRYWSNKSDSFRVISMILAVIDYTQVLMEMQLLRKGYRKHYEWIAGMETIKSLLNLTSFRLMNQRMRLYPNHMTRDSTPSSLDPQRHEQHQQQQLQHLATSHWTAQRTGKSVPLMTTVIKIASDELQHKQYRPHQHQNDQTVTDYADVNGYLMSKVLTAEKLRQPQHMVRAMSFWEAGGEVVSIMRPTFYVFAILVWGRRSWKPWYLSLFMDLLSNGIIRRYCSSFGGGRSSMLPLEKHEYQRRLKLLILYLMKGAFYTRITRPKLEQLCNRLESKSLGNLLSALCRDYLILWENIYFYSSTS